MTDPTDKLLVEAVLSRPRRAKDDLEAAKLASMRPNRVAVPPGPADWQPTVTAGMAAAPAAMPMKARRE